MKVSYFLLLVNRCDFVLEKTKETKNKVTAAKKVEKWEKLDVKLTKILSKTGLDKYKKWSQVLKTKTKYQ